MQGANISPDVRMRQLPACRTLIAVKTDTKHIPNIWREFPAIRQAVAANNISVNRTIDD